MRLYVPLANIVFVSVAVAAHAFSVEATDDGSLQEDIREYSKHIGYAIAEDLRMESDFVNVEAVIQGIREYSQGDSPEVESHTMNERFTSIQKRLFERQAKINLERAEKYLQEVCAKASVHVLEKAALAYEVLDKGQGMGALTEEDTVVVRYLIVDSEGRTVFSEEGGNTNDLPCTCKVDDFLPPISRALVGMVPGERRKIYVHPKLAYGELSHLPPNLPLIVDITLLEIKTECL